MSSPVSRYFNAPRTYKVLVFLLVYLALYVAFGQLLTLVAGDAVDDDNVVGSAGSILVALAIPVLVGAVALVWFVRHCGWGRDVFGRQPVRGAVWMWIGPILVVAAIIGHTANVDWGAWTPAELGALVLLGIGVGIAEEVATRGAAVKMLRDSGHTERFVAVVSSLLFALMHLVNLFAGMDLRTVAFTVLYTFGFGMCMYLTMRVTGTIWAAIVLHGLTDPTTVLSTGGLDTAVNDTGDGTFALVAILATFALIAFGPVAALLVRGKVGDRETGAAPARTTR